MQFHWIVEAPEKRQNCFKAFFSPLKIRDCRMVTILYFYCESRVGSERWTATVCRFAAKALEKGRALFGGEYQCGGLFRIPLFLFAARPGVFRGLRAATRGSASGLRGLCKGRRNF